MQLFDAFISYGRADSKAFATKLQAGLAEQGFNVWFDFNDIPLGVDFQHQIDDGIEKSRHFLFIIAPHSVNSPYCGKEIELAIKCHKRIIPLLHVEQISQETWQQRNPHGTAEDWEAYQAKGLHSSFPNMHPIISKINWVYFREGIDDFDKSLGDLIKLLRSHTDYVEPHTRLLVKALEWERQQKQTIYLLTGEEKQQATSWLKIRFKDEQPPCTPGDLHCEYITESIKNSNNLMTQVFLSYATQDRATMEKIRNSLRRESITVWTNLTDIQTGEDFGEAINRGIEQADNVVYLLSPESINSVYCQQELDLAVSLNKRIIPVLVKETQPNTIPEVLRQIQYINLTDNVREEDYRLDESQLLKILQEDEAYYHEHKMLLTKALKWEQYNNPSLLLRGYNRQSAESWLKVAQKRKQHPPTQLQEEFIAESLRQPPLESLDVFIAYSSTDSDLARKLNDSLQMQGKTTWFDQETIASDTEDFQQEIHQGIKACDNFLFILSPRSVNSPDCKEQVEYAASLNKRLVTVLYHQVNPADLPPELAQVQQIDFNKKDFNANFNNLVRTLDIDREHARSHTKWLQRALEWQEKGKNDDLLLRESAFAIAQNWLQEAQQQNKQPAVTPLHQEYIAKSNDAILAGIKREKFQKRTLQVLAAVATVAFLVSLVLAGIANNRKKMAQIQSSEAKASYSDTLYVSNKKLEALLKALQANKTLQKVNNRASANNKQDVEAVLQQAVFGVREYNLLSGTDGHQAPVLGVAMSPDGQWIASGSEDNTVKLWNRNGELVKHRNQDGKLEDFLGKHEQSVNAVAFSPDGKVIASASVDKTVKLWGLDGTLIKTLAGQDGHTNKVRAVAFSPNGELIASASDDKTIKLWNRDGTVLKTLAGKDGHTEGVNSVAFSPDGKLIASGSEDNTVKLWNRDGTFIKTLEEHQDDVNSVAFSPDGKLIASGSDDDTVKLLNLQDDSIKTLKGHTDDVNSVAFSRDGKLIASGSSDKTIKVWNSNDALLTDEIFLARLTGHTDKVTAVTFDPSVTFDPDSKMIIASANADNTVKLWKLNESFANILYGHKKAVKAVAFSPDEEWIASASDDQTVKLWLKDGTWKKTLSVTDKVRDVVFSPNSQLVAATIRDKTIKIWKRDGALVTTIEEEDQANQVAFSPDGKVIASASDDDTVKLRGLDGRLLKTLIGHQDNVESVAFTPDGKLIVSGSADNTIRLWSSTGKLLSTREKHKGAVNSVSFSPDGTMIASGSVDNTVKLWKREGEQLTFVRDLGNKKDKHTESVNQVVFSPDGKMVASASVDKTVKLWDLDGELKGTFYLHTNAVNGVAFNPKNSQFVASASSDQTVILWDVNEVRETETGKLQQEGCKWLKDYLKANTDLKERDRHLCQNTEN